MIDLTIYGKVYTYSQYKKDVKRMFDSLRSEKNDDTEARECHDIKCESCPLDVLDRCLFKDEVLNALNQIELVRNWALSHPKKK